MNKSIPWSGEYLKEFLEGTHWMMESIHEYAKDKGFWDGDRGTDEKKLLLIHSEVSEAAEALREGNPVYHVKEHHPYVEIDDQYESHFSQVEMELADTIIRIFDYAEKKGMNLPEAIVTKHQINLQRPRLHGGKKF
jgi:NTP pyrophosphatase (non-canonical NTP hydrolase)